MLLDRLETASQYCRLHPGFDAAFDLLRSTPLDEMEPGRYEVMGDTLVLIIENAQGKGRQAARLESHRKYIDVQFTIPTSSAAEEFGWRSIDTCATPQGKFDAAKDIIFYDDEPQLWLPIPPGHFAVFFPPDVHAPLAGDGAVRKAIVKVAVEW